MRLLEVLQKSAAYLEERGVESPRLQVEWMLAQALRVPRLQLYLQFERLLSEAELGFLRTAVRRRGRREPLQHILGTAVFCGMELETGPAALVPRPETELLGERARVWLERRVRERPEESGAARVTALDWGTGTGCLALHLAFSVPGADVVAVDRSPEALALAGRNAARHGLTGRVQWLESDGCAALPPEATFDLVVSNPPYIPTRDIDGLSPEVRDHDPRLALDGGEDGLRFQRQLAGELAGRLRAGGRVMVEFGDDQGPAVAGVFSGEGWIVEAIECDYSGRQRFLVAHRPNDAPPPEKEGP